MSYTELPDPVPGPDEALVRLTVAGVNYMGTGIRQQGAPGWDAPLVLGSEGAGHVVALSENVEDLAVGDRVTRYCHPRASARRGGTPARMDH